MFARRRGFCGGVSAPWGPHPRPAVPSAVPGPLSTRFPLSPRTPLSRAPRGTAATTPSSRALGWEPSSRGRLRTRGPRWILRADASRPPRRELGCGAGIARGFSRSVARTTGPSSRSRAPRKEAVPALAAGPASRAPGSGPRAITAPSLSQGESSGPSKGCGRQELSSPPGCCPVEAPGVRSAPDPRHAARRPGSRAPWAFDLLT